MGDFSIVGLESVHLGMLLGKTAALKDRVLDRHLSPLGITSGQLKVLKTICYGENTAVALCRRLGIDSAAMTRMLSRLERKHLILRSRDEHDQRQVRLALTAKGDELIACLAPSEATAMGEFAGSLSAEELLRLRSLLEKLLSLQTPAIGMDCPTRLA
ncbi:MarR family transcriptional regulator [Pseudomonas sp. PDM23]|uniref:MarR family winged helix-turn-helix transcriptional regulator n=1 Tax=unclassified Pseudomonas TaxID=196821 RepID=UPI00177CFCDE|nr:MULTISPECIES: MarR family transcriptional regulator [unclassified Pseudomonas]MBD9579142.1 MarR family transcriptional regulator [Pseudomonas sp. PDM23]MBD9672872.1 MarR family transcriptional regulator [Pseudomonas sp. PDM21]